MLGYLLKFLIIRTTSWTCYLEKRIINIEIATRTEWWVRSEEAFLGNPWAAEWKSGGRDLTFSPAPDQNYDPASRSSNALAGNRAVARICVGPTSFRTVAIVSKEMQARACTLSNILRERWVHTHPRERCLVEDGIGSILRWGSVLYLFFTSRLTPQNKLIIN